MELTSINANNHITTAPFTYDAAGNETADTTLTYTWNAEGELKTAGGVTYTYDGDGRRVQKSNGKLYWYGNQGEILNESDLSGTMTEAYVYFDGKRIGHHNSSSQYFYYAEDFIGSSRVITTSAGATCYDADFYPYGAESPVTNTCPQNYKWTGKERDAETGNDDFDARYYSSTYGRFLSADWSAVPAPVPYANLTNPQTLNLYAIVRDNPESFADLDGHMAALGTPGACGDAYTGCGGVDQNASSNTAAQNAAREQTVTATANGNTVTLTRVSWNEDPSTRGKETIETRTGEHPFRDNNPGDIKMGSFASSTGAVGNDKGIAIFPDAQTGSKSLDTLLNLPRYQNLTLDQTVERYAPPSENNTAAYQDSIRQQVGVGGATKLSSLSSGQMQRLEGGIAQVEGFYHGGTVSTETIHIFPAP